MADRRRTCSQCRRKVWVLDTDGGLVWEMHNDRSGRRCGNSGRPAQ